MQAHILSLRPEEKRIITEAKRKRKVICESKSDIEQRLISDIDLKICRRVLLAATKRPIIIYSSAKVMSW